MTKRVHADVRHRWNSTFLMMERLLELKVPLTKVLQSHHLLKVRLLVLSPLNWELIEEVVQILHPVYDATTCLSGDVYPTLGLVHVVYSSLIAEINDIIDPRFSDFCGHWTGFNSLFDRVSTVVLRHSLLNFRHGG